MPDVQQASNKIERRIGALLKVGMVLSASTIAIGGWLFLYRQGGSILDYHAFKGEPTNLRTLAGIFAGTVRGNPLAIIQCGMLFLIATPIARVVFSFIEFFRTREYLYVVSAGLVLSILLSSLLRQ